MVHKYAEIFCWKNVRSFSSAKATHIFSAKNIRILYIESAKTVHEMTLTELVKLTMLWTTGPSTLDKCLRSAYWVIFQQTISLYSFLFIYFFFFFKKIGFDILCNLGNIQKKHIANVTKTYASTSYRKNLITVAQFLRKYAFCLWFSDTFSFIIRVAMW